MKENSKQENLPLGAKYRETLASTRNTYVYNMIKSQQAIDPES